MKGWRTDWFNRKLMLKVRNSAKGQVVFGQVQKGEHEVECMVTHNNNSWIGSIRWENRTFLYVVFCL